MEEEMKTKNNSSAYIIRSAAWAGFLSFGFIALGLAVDSPNEWHKSAGATSAYATTAKSLAQTRELTFAERVAYQRAIEDIYWRYRIWPKENRNPKPSLDAVMSKAQLENKVTDYLRNSQELEEY